MIALSLVRLIERNFRRTRGRVGRETGNFSHTTDLRKVPVEELRDESRRAIGAASRKRVPGSLALSARRKASS